MKSNKRNHTNLAEKFSIRRVCRNDEKTVKGFIREHWYGDSVIAHGVVFYPHKLPGFFALREEVILGLITFHIFNNKCEIVTLNSVIPGRGIGTALLSMVQSEAERSGCKRLWLVTTNDNLDALGFYQKRGFVLSKLHRNAVEHSRKIKPSIPLYGIESIPIRDELELEKLLEI